MSSFIETLDALIEDRKQNPTSDSYTQTLLQDPALAAQKVGEETTETVIAALVQDDDRLLDEAADLTYHLLVLLHTRNLSWKQVVSQLESRH